MELKVPFLNVTGRQQPLEEISIRLDQQERHSIAQTAWPQGPCPPSVLFSVAYSPDAVLVKYFVKETAIRVSTMEDNSPVHVDSCVEFFIAFDKEAAYYNFEFNCIGTALLGFGTCKTNRQLLPTPVLSRIRRAARIGSMKDSGHRQLEWELTIVIPFDVFVFHKITSMKNKSCRANFFKCGDNMPEPHFLSWVRVESATPDFHLPAYFGDMHYV